MAVELDTQDEQTTIHIQGRFMFTDVYQEFTKAYESEQFVNASARVVNLDGVEVIDSSGLAMLLKMREFLGGDQANIRIVGGSHQINNILNYAGFNSIFSID